MIDGIVHHAVRRSATTLIIDVHEPVTRHEARLRGFSGPLRGPLALRQLGGGPPRGLARYGSPAEELAAAVNELVPTRPLAPRALSGPWSRLASRAVTGQPASLHFTVEAHDLGSFLLSVPDRLDLMPEAVAAACDTAIAIYRAFPREMRALRTISFDRSEQGFSERSKRRLGGVAHQGLGTIRLNAAYVAADALVELAQHRAGHPSPRPPLRSRPPATAIDYVMTHELGHIVDGVFEAERYRDTIEFRRELGRALGVATLEHAIRPRLEDGPAGQAAFAALRDTVSAYATTNLKEAMAELFTAWWWRPATDLPVIQRYDQLIHRFFNR